MFRKYIAAILLPIFLLGQILVPITIHAVPTDGLANNWTREKAEHLARKVLFYPTPAEVTELYNAGSATAAVDILFPSESGPDRTQYNNELTAFTTTQYTAYYGSGAAFGWNTNQGNMRKYFLYKHARDPYEAKAKLSTLFEDIYSVNVEPGRIEYGDIIALHNLLYTHTLGNYKTLVKRALLNNPTDKGDYAASQFLDLLNQGNFLSPNENYPREMLQLFLMGEYLPGDSKDDGDPRNYSEADVAALSRIITGYWADNDPNTDNDTSVYYRTDKHNTASGLTFLAGNTGGVNFPFYDAANDVVDGSGMQLPILGNNGLGDNIVDYIFAKRSHAVAMFLAEKFYKFYVDEKYTRSELESFAAQIEANNFELFPSIKWLLVQDFMYSDESMNSVLYSNPLELVIGLFKVLHAQDPDTFDTNFLLYGDLLARLGWTPYVPGSIFGRDGYDTNHKWFSASTATQWTNLVTTITYDYTQTGSYLIDNIVPVTSMSGSDITMDDLISQVEDNLLLGRPLPVSVKNIIKNFLTTSETGAPIAFQPNLPSYKNLKFPGVFAIALAQPEFILKSGYDRPVDSQVSEPSKIENATGTLIVVELPGGYDWLNGIISKSDYPNYQAARTNASGETIAQSLTGLVDIGDFYMNRYLAYSGGDIANGPALKQQLDNGNLKIFNRVGTSLHSRDHDQAQRQMVSIDNTVTGGKGILGSLSEFDPNSTNIYVMGGKQPNILQGGNYVNLGTSDNRIAHSNPKSRLNTNQRNHFVSTIMSSFTGRTYPGKTGDRYGESIDIHELANTSVSQGGSPGVGNTTAAQLNFTKTLLDNGEGKIYYIQNTGNGYDTHKNQLVGSTNLDIGVGKAVADITAFFEQIKGTHNVTIVTFSEFGRTMRVNGGAGTDHGQGGGMFVLTNNPTILSSMTGTIYGGINTALERDDWLSPGIDYRNVYGRIMSGIYGIPEGEFFDNYRDRTLEDDLSLDPAELPLLHTEFVPTSNTKLLPYVKFYAEGKNYDFTKGSYVISAYSTGGSYVYDTRPFLSENISNYARLSPNIYGEYTFDPNGVYDFPESSTYNYLLNPVTNQYIENPYSGGIMLPEVLTSSVNTVNSGSHSLLRRYQNTTVIPSGSTLSGFILASHPSAMTQFAPQDGVSLRAYTGTTLITSLSSSGVTRVWNGGFIIGEKMTSPGFLPKNAYLIEDNLLLKDFSTSNTVRIGADVLGIGMQLSQPVEVTITGATANTLYYVFTSEDGVAWKRQSPTPYTSDANGNVVFDTDHFSLFTLAEVPAAPLCDLQVDDAVISDGSTVQLSWSTLGADTVSISPSIGSVGYSGSIGVIPPVNTSTTYTLQAVNAQGTGTCQTVVRSVPLPTCSISTSTASVKNGTPVTITWTGAHATAATLTPDGSIVPTSASIGITPPSSTTTNYGLTVTNDVGSDTCTTSVTTYANSAPVANADSMSVLENNSSHFGVLANDTDADIGDILTIASITSTPNHGTAQISGTGILFTGTGGYCGPDSFSYRIQDQDGALSPSATVSVNISCGMNPAIVSDVLFTGDEDGTISGTLTGTDIDGDTLTFFSASGVSHGMLNLLSDGTFLYTPTANYNGSDSFQYYAYDGTQSGATSTVTFTVNSVNDLPITLADSGSTNMNSPTFIDVLANDTDIDHTLTTSTINITALPMSGAVIQTGSMLLYTPIIGYCGADTFDYTITDGSGGISNISRVTLDILCVSNAPIATSDTTSGVEDTAFTFDFITNDTDPDFATGSDSIAFHDFVTLPAHGTVMITTSGAVTANRSNEVFTYTPNANYCGTDTWTYRVHDAITTVSNAASVTITIACTNDAPTVGDVTRTGYSDVSYTGVLSATDIDSSSFTYQIVHAATSGTASLTSTGYYEYIPQSSTFSGTDSFEYVATDSSGAVSNTGRVTFSLTEAPVVYTYTGSDIVSTGSAQILTGVTLESGEILDLNGKTITATASSGSTGSIVLPGTLDILIDSGIWSGEILAPSLLPVNDTRNIALTDAGVAPVLPSSTPTMTYTYIVADTFKAGAEGVGLSLTGGYANIEFVVDTPGVVFGSRLQLLRSQDGVTWEANYPDTSCIVDNELKCTFRTNHLTYFGTVQQLSTPVVQPSLSLTGPGGYYSAAPSIPPYISTPLSGTGYMMTGSVRSGYIPSPSQTYIDWVKKYQPRYKETYLAERIYWDILKKNDSIDERTEAVDITVIDMMEDDESLVDIALMINDLWEAKLAWQEKLKWIQK